MLIAVLSESHDNIWNLGKALAMIEEIEAEMLIHCGDYCAPFVLAELAKFKGPVHGVFGNVDGDKFLMANMANKQFSNIMLHGDIGELDIDCLKLAFTHSPKVARGLAASGEFEAVFYGHTHERAAEEFGGCKLVNPGEVMGRINRPSFCIFDTAQKQTRHLELG
jgi:putative phosphoesterase